MFRKLLLPLIIWGGSQTATAEDRIDFTASAKAMDDHVQLIVDGQVLGKPVGSRVRIQFKRNVTTSAPMGFLPALEVVAVLDHRGFHVERPLDFTLFPAGRYVLTVSAEGSFQKSQFLWLGTCLKRMERLSDQRRRVWHEVKAVEDLVVAQAQTRKPLSVREIERVNRNLQDMETMLDRAAFPWSCEILAIFWRSLTVAGSETGVEAPSNMYGDESARKTLGHIDEGNFLKLVHELKKAAAREYALALIEELDYMIDTAEKAAGAAKDKDIPEAVLRKLKADLTAVQSADAHAREVDFGDIYKVMLKNDKGADQLQYMLDVVKAVLENASEKDQKEAIKLFQSSKEFLASQLSKPPDIPNTDPGLPR